MKKICLFLTTMVVAIAANAANTYTKVTSTPEDWTGTYLIVCESQNVVFNGGADTAKIDAKGGPAILTDGFTISNDTLYGSLTVDTATFTIDTTDNETWHWYIKSTSGLYLGHKDTADNGLSTEFDLEEKCKQKLEIDAEGNFVATAQFPSSTTYVLRYNSDVKQLRFRYYKSGKQIAIQIYKLVSSPSEIIETSATKFVNAKKIVRNGQLIIVKDGKEFNVLGN